MRAVVIGGMPLGEADRLVRYLSAERGRGAVVARGARRSVKRFGGLLDLGTRLDLDVGKGRGSLEVLLGATAIAFPVRARTELGRIALLAYGCELCGNLAGEGEASPRLFHLLEVWLDLLEGEATPGHASRIALEAKALTFAGLAPVLEICPVCGHPLGDPVVFDEAGGGGRHAHCGGGARVTLAALARLEALRRTPLADTAAGDLSDLDGRARWLLSGFARYQLGKELQSRALVEELG